MATRKPARSNLVAPRFHASAFPELENLNETDTVQSLDRLTDGKVEKMTLIVCCAAMAMLRQVASPILWLDTQGNVLVQGREYVPIVTPGVTANHTSKGVVYDFSGNRGGILFGDPDALKLSGSMTISSWIYLRSYANNGAQAQILFRGDDRNGLDPYCLAAEADGTMNFTINNAQGQGMGVKTEVPLNQWLHVLASFNDQTGELAMWVNGEKTAFARTAKHPFTNLQAQFTPGVGVGNVQNNHGPHNQPLNGMIADLRLYTSALTPEDVSWFAPGTSKQP